MSQHDSPLRSALTDAFAHPLSDAVRVFHGRGHLFPGLEHINVDWYPPVLLITTYQPPEQTDLLVAMVREADLHSQVGTVLLQHRTGSSAPCIRLAGDPVETCVVTEGALRFEIQPGRNQNPGLFLDMRPLRDWLQQYCEGLNVLNLFAYTCSLSVAALHGGASGVVNVDMSKPAITWGDRNHALNDQDRRLVRSVPHNLFRSWGRIKQYGRYDLVIIDPPSRQRGSFNIERDYPAVLKKLKSLTTSSASVIATVNSPYLGPDYLPNLMQRHASEFHYSGTIPAAPEFADRYPDRGLKIHQFRRRN